ncbi:MAG: DUF4390 domain-containing protein [Gammaproteobacteria bacterium]
MRCRIRLHSWRGLVAGERGTAGAGCCAAPGGKTCQLLETVPELELWALDKDAGRLQQVRANLQRLGLQAQLLTADAAQPDDWWDGQSFDRILLDAPCSGSGVIRRHPDIKLLRRVRDIETLAAQQIALLCALWPLLRPGGQLLYATCSVLPAETTQVITRFCNAQPDTCIEPIAAEWGQAVETGRYILPGSSGMDGFFYARLRKSSKLLLCRTAARRCASLRRFVHAGFVVFLGLLLISPPAWTAGFNIIRATTRLEQAVYVLDADIAYDLSPAVADALNNSVPLTIQLDMQIQRNRPMLWDETVAALQQRFRITYHALAQQYVVANLNSDQQYSFPPVKPPSEFVGRIRDFPLLDRSLLQPDQRYMISLRAELDIEALPAPYAPQAYLSTAWRLTSDWYTWPL